MYNLPSYEKMVSNIFKEKSSADITFLKRNIECLFKIVDARNGIFRDQRTNTQKRHIDTRTEKYHIDKQERGSKKTYRHCTKRQIDIQTDKKDAQTHRQIYYLVFRDYSCCL